jgi:hypothetical protein
MRHGSSLHLIVGVLFSNSKVLSFAFAFNFTPQQHSSSSLQQRRSRTITTFLHNTKDDKDISRSNGGDIQDAGNGFRDQELPVHTATQKPAGLLCLEDWCVEDDLTHRLSHHGTSRKRVLVLCTGGTLTMSNDPAQGNSLAPVQGALVSYKLQVTSYKLQVTSYKLQYVSCIIE